MYNNGKTYSIRQKVLRLFGTFFINEPELSELSYQFCEFQHFLGIFSAKLVCFILLLLRFNTLEENLTESVWVHDVFDLD